MYRRTDCGVAVGSGAGVGVGAGVSVAVAGIVVGVMLATGEDGCVLRDMP